MAQTPINAGAIPQPQINAGWLDLAAGWLNDDGTTIKTAGADLRATWHGLSGVYHAPEAPELFAAMDPVATATESFASDVGQVSKALTTFAAEAGPLAATLASTQADASTFASSVSGNDKWDHDQSLVNKNNAFIHTVNTTVVAYEAAERRAANAIEALIGGTQFHTITSAADAKDPYAYGYDSIPDNTKGVPWGAAVTKKDGCAKTALNDVGDVFVGAYEWGKGLVTGIGDLVGFGGWEKFKQSWEGMAFLATMVTGPGGWVLGSAMFGGPAAYAKRYEAFTKGLLDWDEWKTHPFRAATQVILNVGTLAVPGADGAGAAADIAKGADYAADAGKAADLADAGKLAKTVNITKDAFATINTITDPLHWLGQLPKVIDFANGMKFPELVGTGSKDVSTLDNAMKDWDHEPTPVGAGHDPRTGTGSHDPGTGTGSHDPGTGTGSGGHDPGTGTGSHDPGTGSHDPGTGSHDPGTGTGTHDPGLPSRLKTQPFETPHGYGPDTHEIGPDHKPIDPGTTNSNKLGKIGEQLTQQDLESRGYKVLLTQFRVKIPGTGKYFIPDFIARDPEGHLVLVESKFGSGARFTDGQLSGYKGYSSGGLLEASSPAGKTRLDDVLLREGISGRVDRIEVYRWNTVITPDPKELKLALAALLPH